MNPVEKAVRESDLSIKELADKLDVTTATIYNYINGTTKPTHGNRRRIAEELDISLAELMKWGGK